MYHEFMFVGVGLAVKVMILRQLSLEAAGHFTAAWTLGALYTAMIVKAMGADFFPKLSAVGEDDKLTNKYVNQQTEVILLISGPGIIATIVLAPLLIVLLYTPEFSESVSVLRWICLGMCVRLLTWSMGFVIACRQRVDLLLLTETAWGLAAVTLTYGLIPHFGIDGAGIAFFGTYLVHSTLILTIVRRLSDFHFSPHCRRIIAQYVLLILIAFSAVQVIPDRSGLTLALLTLIANAVFSARKLGRLVASDRIPRVIKTLLTRFGIHSE
jgi:PST family polysaccharide transporter